MEQASPVFKNFKREKEELPATLSTTYDSLTIFREPTWHDNYGYRHHRLACHAKSKKKVFSCAVGAALSNMAIIGPAGLGPGAAIKPAGSGTVSGSRLAGSSLKDINRSSSIALFLVVEKSSYRVCVDIPAAHDKFTLRHSQP
ncbi:hypothetical protein [Burkholderia arboris]|uniref:hypothetical protein n=1 Tax=Burkholderia arboris TaxID=488730 RepID=UPI00158388EB|nr:hypothetical protein [Burkholderia arboris]